ncbi:MAG: hypothetical protein KGO51_13070 [Alphaproteobacteria bacterium]|nr:hypothetical protein [Alphaproteobacteria bacterium]
MARGNAHVPCPARVQLVAAMNLANAAKGTGRGVCGRRRPARLTTKAESRAPDGLHRPAGRGLADARRRAGAAATSGMHGRGGRPGAGARALQVERAAGGAERGVVLDAQAQGERLEGICALDLANQTLLGRAAESGGPTARGYAAAT